jgi:hypothetical protein
MATPSRAVWLLKRSHQLRPLLQPLFCNGLKVLFISVRVLPPAVLLDELHQLIAGALHGDASPHHLLAHIQVDLAGRAAHVSARIHTLSLQEERTAWTLQYTASSPAAAAAPKLVRAQED